MLQDAKMQQKYKKLEINESQVRQFWRKWKKHRIAFLSGIFILFLIALAIFGTYITPYNPSKPNYNATLLGPTIEHFAGTDEYGRDIFSRVIAGTKISLSVAFLSVSSGAVVGTILGLISGYFGGWIDRFIMRACDVLLAFPDLLLAIGIVAILGPGIVNAIIAIAVFTIPNFARVIRGTTLEVKQAEFVEAAESMGANHFRIIFRHILPESFSSLFVFFTLRIGNAIIVAATLSFLGLGASPETPDWGVMLSMGRDYISVAPHVIIMPGLAVFLTVLAFNLFGDGLRDVLDPKY